MKKNNQYYTALIFVLFSLYTLNLSGIAFDKKNSNAIQPLTGQTEKKSETISKIKSIGSFVGEHLVTHSLLYALGTYLLYYHVLNQKALINRYRKIPLGHSISSTLRRMCNTIGLNYDKLNVIQVDGFENPPLLKTLFSTGAHVIGTNTIVLGNSTDDATLAHELTHIKNKHVPKILFGIFAAPLAVDLVSYVAKLGLAKINVSQPNKKNEYLTKAVAMTAKPLNIVSKILRGTIAFIIALKILHACERDADVAYAKPLMGTSDLNSGKVHRPKLRIPLLNIDLAHLWHPIAD